MICGGQGVSAAAAAIADGLVVAGLQQQAENEIVEGVRFLSCGETQ
jgi:hypothetical protein